MDVWKPQIHQAVILPLAALVSSRAGFSYEVSRLSRLLRPQNTYVHDIHKEIPYFCHRGVGRDDMWHEGLLQEVVTIIEIKKHMADLFVDILF